MSWIDKELKKRAAMASGRTALKSSQPGDAQTTDEGTRMASLWEKFEAQNNALPETLKLRRDVDRKDSFTLNAPAFRVWLMASNGAGLGFTGDGIRYTWPQEGKRRSNNFWIRWSVDSGFQLSQRVGLAASGPSLKFTQFNEEAVGRMIECLVVGTRIQSKSVCKRRRWWWFT